LFGSESTELVLNVTYGEWTEQVKLIADTEVKLNCFYKLNLEDQRNNSITYPVLKFTLAPDQHAGDNGALDPSL